MDELVSAMMLSSARHLSLATKVDMMERAGSAQIIFDNHKDIRSVIPDASDNLVEIMKSLDSSYQWAEQELQFCHEHGIKVLHFFDNDYPKRLRECVDAPMVLYYRGSTDLNSAHIISIVGTRRCTSYGTDCVRRLIDELREKDNNIIIVSGLAYGIDISAHRYALANGIDTVAVLAHGLDDLYPASHRETAVQMLKHGGLLTEYPSHSRADKKNFVSRNRIVAGLSDATILVESPNKGGGLITAEIAKSYSRDVFAFPGRIVDATSEGCNRLIRDNTAAMITSADDLLKAMSWYTDEHKTKKLKNGVERQLFPELSADEQLIVKVLQENNDLQLNMLMAKTGIAISRLTSVLFEMEMKGVLRALAGGVYHLL